ncbi:phage-related tail protein [Weissella uvarum]|uniref:hypothetical protein n=1 Tax=Weissella uvarum TaxID=1479233 RepID=UPI001961FC73|nr:hypothetical protein [Weissella uvarum]MBM7617381.1 phage-related tail protein [Weissella uvarum]MCM0595733.1 hypothetical protein [Weissella uvarum]
MKRTQLIIISIIALILSGLFIHSGIQAHRDNQKLQFKLYQQNKQLEVIDLQTAKQKSNSKHRSIDLSKTDKFVRDFSLKALNYPVRNSSEFQDYKNELSEEASSTNAISELLKYRQPNVISKTKSKPYTIVSLSRQSVQNGNVNYLVILKSKDSAMPAIVFTINRRFIKC